MPGDVPFAARLAQLTPVPAAAAASLIERLDEPNADPVIGPLFGTDDEGDTVVNPLVPAVLQALAQKEGLTCYAALLEGLTASGTPPCGPRSWTGCARPAYRRTTC